MGLKDRFRIDELVKKGSKAIPRDKRGGIRVRKRNGKQIPQGYKRDEKGRFVPKPPRAIPFGKKPIRGFDSKRKRFKSDFVDTLPPIKNFNDFDRDSFGGETSGRIERPVYDEKELQKAIDIKVDELIKPKKETKGKFVPLKRYNKLLAQFTGSQEQIKAVTDDLTSTQAGVAGLEGQVSSLEGTVDGLGVENDQLQQQLSESNQKYEDLLKDFQTALIKGTKEGIERASLSARAEGLQAQVSTLQAQLTAQQDIVKSLQQAAEVQQQVQEQVVEAKEKEVEAAKQTSLLGLVEDKGQFQVKGTVGWALATSSANRKPEWAARWDDRRKGPKGRLSGLKYDWYNMGPEPVTLKVQENVIKNKKWLNGVPNSLTIPASPDGGSTPGMKSVTFSRGGIGKGTYETEIIWTNQTTNEKFKMKTRYWQARRRRKT